jgi:hypothetical protein
LSNWANGRFGDLKVVAVSSQPEQLRDRTKAFALRVIRLYRSLPYKTDAQLGKQLLDLAPWSRRTIELFAEPGRRRNLWRRLK